MGNENKPEGSFAEPLLRLDMEFVINAFLSLAVLSACYRITCTCAVLQSLCQAYEKRISDFGYRSQGFYPSLAFLTSLSGTKSISLLRSTVGWGGQNRLFGISRGQFSSKESACYPYF